MQLQPSIELNQVGIPHQLLTIIFVQTGDLKIARVCKSFQQIIESHDFWKMKGKCLIDVFTQNTTNLANDDINLDGICYGKQPCIDEKKCTAKTKNIFKKHIQMFREEFPSTKHVESAKEAKKRKAEDPAEQQKIYDCLLNACSTMIRNFRLSEDNQQLSVSIRIKRMADLIANRCYLPDIINSLESLEDIEKCLKPQLDRYKRNRSV